MREIAIRGTNWIGDAVMSVPAIRELRRIYPDARISLLVNDWVSGVYAGQNLIDSLVNLGSDRALGSEVRGLAGQSFDLCVLFRNAFRSAFSAFLARIPERVGYSTDRRGLLLTRRAKPRITVLHRHQLFYYLDLLFQTGLSEVDYLSDPRFQADIRLTPTKASSLRASAMLQDMGLDTARPLVGLNPGAYFGPAKRWFTGRYASLADRLILEAGFQVVLFGSAGERRISDEILSHMKARPFVLTGSTDLPTLMALIKRCNLFVTNDSGPMHLAAALDVPQIALFGSTDEVATGPFSPRARVIHKHVECSPCLLRECPIDLRCFKKIEVDEVFQLCRELL